MIPLVGKLFGGSAAKVVGAAIKGIDKAVYTKEERAELLAKGHEADAIRQHELMLVQAQINLQDARSKWWFQAGWRPYVGWSSGTMINLVGTAIVFNFLYSNVTGQPMQDIPPQVAIILGLYFGVISSMLGIGIKQRTNERIAGLAAAQQPPTLNVVPPLELPSRRVDITPPAERAVPAERAARKKRKSRKQRKREQHRSQTQVAADAAAARGRAAPPDQPAGRPAAVARPHPDAGPAKQAKSTSLSAPAAPKRPEIKRLGESDIDEVPDPPAVVTAAKERAQARGRGRGAAPEWHLSSRRAYIQPTIDNPTPNLVTHG